MLRPPLLSVVLVALAGCSDVNLLGLPEESSEDVVIVATEPTREEVDSPWDDLDPGARPEVAFFVAWGDVTVALGDGGLHTRLDVVDLDGRVLAHFDPPEPNYTEPLAIRPAGPGRVMVTTESPRRPSRGRSRC